VVVVADDLMWSTRIVEAVRRAGGTAVPLASERELAIALQAEALAERRTLAGAIVDLAARRFDAVAAIERVHDARLPVIAVAEHDDQLTRKRALQAGAARVFAYRTFFEDGTRLVSRWLEASRPDLDS
jgi:DNA-binding NarL/FixJ family response regulator